MQNLIDRLEQKKRFQLISVLEKQGQTPVNEYSSKLHDYSPSFPIELELLQAFQEELQRLGHESSQIESILLNLKNKRVLQTSTHLTLTEGPTFFALHWIASLGMMDSFYIIGAYSGIPFTNNAWPGCLNYSSRYSLNQLLDVNTTIYKEVWKAEQNRNQDSSESRVSLVPGALRDALVYRSIIPERTQQIISGLTPSIKKWIPHDPKINESYTQWALQCCQGITRHALSQPNIVYLDLNEVISAYLIKVLSQSEHFITKLLFDSTLQPRILEVFGQDISLFMIPNFEKKKEKFKRIKLKEETVDHSISDLMSSPEKLAQSLATQRLCPGLFLTFTILCFLNGFKCLGSFDQIEYLSDYKEKWMKLGLFPENRVQHVPTNGLTTGRFIDSMGQPIFPLDIALGSQWEFPKENTALIDLIYPMMDRLLK